MDMAALDAALAISDDSLTITGATLPGSGLDRVLTAFNNGSPLVIAEAEKRSSPNLISVTGKTSFAKVANAAVNGQFSINAAGNPYAVIRFTLPEGWTFSDSFPDPTGEGAAREELDELTLTEAALVFCSEAGHDPAGAKLDAGLNLVAKLHLDPFAALLEAALGGATTATLQASVNPLLGASPAPLPADESPWDDVGWTVPGILAQADLGIDLQLGEATLSEVRLHFYSPPSSEWAEGNRSYQARQGLSGLLDFEKAGIKARLDGSMTPGASAVTISAAIAGAGFRHLESLVGLAPNQSFGEQLPDGARQAVAAIEELAVTEMVISFDGGLLPTSVSLLGLTIGFPGTSWPLLPDLEAQVSDVQFLVTEPFGGDAQLAALVGGTVKIGGQPLEASTELPDLALRAQLPEDESAAAVGTSDLTRDHAPHLDLPGLSIDELSLYVKPGSEWSMEATMADEPPWELDLGPHQVTISDVELNLSKEAEEDAEGSMSGLLMLDEELAVEAQYELPGDLMVRAQLPEVSLSRLIELLDEAGITLPTEFDLSFDDAYVLIDSGAEGERLTAATEIKGLGWAAFTAERHEGKTGVAVGLELAQPASTLTGLGALGALESLVGLTDLMLVVSSLEQPGFQLPAMASFGAAAVQGAQLKLPSQAKGLVRGLNLYGRLSATNSPALQALARWLGIDLEGTAAVTLGVSLPDPATDSKLLLAVETKVDGVAVAGDLGLLMQEGEPAAFLDATVTATVEGEPLLFGVAASASPNGVLVEGTMKGSISFEGVTISDLALVVGIDLEGVPSLGFAGSFDVPAAKFDGALAIFLDANDPGKSVLAGSVNELTLGEVVKALAPSAPIPAAVSGALDQIGIKGLAAFELPASRIESCDNRDLAAISSAFAQQGRVSLPASSDKVLLHVAERGKEWHLTDLTTMTHYSLLAGEQGIAVSLDPQVYIAPQQVRIGDPKTGLTFPQGMHVEGRLDLLVTEVRTKVEVASGGIVADVEADPVEFAGGILKLTDAKGTGGPRVSLATFAQAGKEAPFDQPHFLLTGRLDVLGLEVAAAEIEIDAEGLRVDVTEMVVPGVRIELVGVIKDRENMALSGAASVGVKTTIDLGPLGSLPLDDEAGGTVTVALAAGAASVSFAGSLVFQGEEIPVPSFNLPIETGVLTRLGDLVEDELGVLLKSFVADAERWLDWVHAGVIQGIADVATIARVLGQQLGQDAEAIATLMKGAGYAVDAVAAALRDGLTLGAHQVMEALTEAGYAVADAAAEVQRAFSLSLTEMVGVLEAAELALPTITVVLGELGDGASEVARALVEAGVDAESAAQAVESSLEASATEVATGLREAGVGVEEIGAALQSAYTLSATEVGEVLHEVGVDAEAIGAVLRNVFELSANEVSSFAKSALGVGEEAVHEVLGAAGYAVSEIENWFESW